MMGPQQTNALKAQKRPVVDSYCDRFGRQGIADCVMSAEGEVLLEERRPTVGWEHICQAAGGG